MSDEKLPLAECTTKTATIPADKLYPAATQRFYVLSSAGLELTSEGGSVGERTWMEHAWIVLRPERAAKWKTLGILRTLRQAFRENYAQCMGLDYPDPGTGERRLKAWIAAARVFDTKHHGQATF